MKHNWLTAAEAAELMGVQTQQAVRARAVRGRLPSEVHDGRRWFRRDHLELVRNADAAMRGRAPRWLGAWLFVGSRVGLFHVGVVYAVSPRNHCRSSPEVWFNVQQKRRYWLLARSGMLRETGVSAAVTKHRAPSGPGTVGVLLC